MDRSEQLKKTVDCPRCKGSGKIVKKKKRSLNQNRYYWSVVLKMAAIEMGEIEDDVHEIFKYKFNSVKKVLPDRSIVNKPNSTTSLDTAEFERYLNECRGWCLLYLNLNIPLPNQVTEDILLSIENDYYLMLDSIN